MDNITFNLTPQQYQQLLTALQELPYKKAAPLIQLLQQQVSGEKTADALSLTKNEEQEFEIGDKVRARWLGGSTWFNGAIRDFKNGRYFIQYDDGDEEWTTAGFIQLLFKPGKPDSNANPNFQIGDRVEARWMGGATWYPGTIQDIRDGKYFILYEDGGEEWTTVDLMVKI